MSESRSWSSIQAELNQKFNNRARRFAQGVRNNRFLQNLKAAAEENPVLVLAATAAVMTAGAKLIKAHGESQGSRAYAQQVAYRIKKGS